MKEDGSSLNIFAIFTYLNQVNNVLNLSSYPLEYVIYSEKV